MGNSTDSHLNILLDLQKQLGDLKSETVKQSQVLLSIDAQVKKTDLRVSILEDTNSIAKNTSNIKKGKLIVWGTIGGFIGAVTLALFIGFIKNTLNLE